jgi:hypothetical protein
MPLLPVVLGKPTYLRVVRQRPRVEVDAPLVGLLGVVAAAVPGMELHRRHLHGPDHRAELGHAELVGRAVPSREVQPDRLDPGRRTGRHPLLVDLVAGEPRREAVQHGRPLEERVDDAGADREVVLDQVELRRSALGEVHAVGVGHLDDAVVHLDLDEGRGHRATVTGWSV